MFPLFLHARARACVCVCVCAQALAVNPDAQSSEKERKALLAAIRDEVSSDNSHVLIHDDTLGMLLLGNPDWLLRNLHDALLLAEW